MKPKKLPISVVLWLTFLGFDVGFIIGAMVFSINLLAWIFGFFILFIGLLLLHIFYRDTLEEWELIKPPKKKKKKERGSDGKKRSN